MKNTMIILFFTFLSGLLHAQSSVTHQVKKGESLLQIAQKYGVSEEEIYKFNPSAKNGISEKTILYLKDRSAFEFHEVLAKETAFGIAKRYNITLELFYQWNPDVKDSGLKIGQHVAVKKKEQSAKTISNKESSSTKNATGTKTNVITVAPGETIYSIAVQNKTTVSKIFELNPEVEKNGLKVNQELIIPSSDIKARAEVKSEDKPIIAKSINSGAKTIIVQPKETIYNISKSYNVSIEDLNNWNPQLREGLQTGMELVVGYPSVKKFDLVKENSTSNVPSKAKSNKQGEKELILLLPFNIDKINMNDKAALNQKLNSDVFLNMTLDFYSGALLAIEQAGQNDTPISVKIFDSKESNRSMDVNALKTQFDFSNADVIIGPFFQKNVDAISKVFEDSPTWIVSPLSTEKGKPFPNQVHTMPSADVLAKEMMDFVISKNQNIVGVSNQDGTKAYDIRQHNNVRMVAPDAKGKFSKAAIKDLLVEGVKNYVILDTNNLETAIDVVANLMSLQKQYTIQLVSLDKNDILDSSEIRIQDLAQLQLLFPSVTNDTSNPVSESFSNRYRDRFGSNPNRFAVRGFDVTHDVISRIFKVNEDEMFQANSEQIENKFHYKSENGGIYNNAVYFLQYSDNLTLKEAK